MTQVANCKKCGVLFIQTSKRDICDKCFEMQNKTLNDMNEYVNGMEEETISIETLLQKFGMERKEFEELFSAGKFVQIAKRVTMICSKCGNCVSIANKTATICADCTRKIQNNI